MKKQVFIKTLILEYYNLMYYIQIKTNIFEYSIENVSSYPILGYLTLAFNLIFVIFYLR